MESKLKPYSLGIVVEHKPRGSSTILVSPVETLNLQDDGKIREVLKNFKGTIPDSTNSSFKTEQTATNHIRAKWLPLGASNRTTPPDVRAGETVLIYKFANVEEYFWEDAMTEPELRRLEDVLYSYSNLSGGSAPHDLESSYWVRVNTKDKYIHLHTTSSDGEPFEYDIKIDTAVGSVKINDNVGNDFKLDSPSNTVEINTQHECNITTATNINLTTGSTVKISAGSLAHVIAPNITLDGDTTVTKSLTVQGPTKLIKSLTVQGPTTAMKVIDVNDIVLAKSFIPK